jgi:hypothetical protein
MFGKYFNATKDKENIEDAIEVLNASLKSLLTKIELANQGAIRGENITSEQINKHAMIHLKDSENAIKFWRDFVPVKSWQINTQKASFYLKQFIVAYNSQQAVEDQIKMDNIQLALARLLDKDNSGTVTPNEIADFFIDIWDDEKTRMKLNRVSKEIKSEESDLRSYLLIQQICKELGLDYYFEIIRNKGVNTKMFLNSSYEALKAAFKEIDSEHISLLFLKAQAHNDRKNFFFDIKDRAMVVEKDGRDVAHQVERALHEGKL